MMVGELGMVVVEVGNHFLLLPVLVVLERLGVLVPEVVVDHRVQPGRVEVHVLLGVLLVGHCCAWCLKKFETVYCMYEKGCIAEPIFPISKLVQTPDIC